mmetsp:Transcript_27645/g.46274  ORF Transcript_27645/g.46274 Transcript_27645/m.46274 type:complete len:228 (-) Transcript_27645:900-1583(-)
MVFTYLQSGVGPLRGADEDLARARDAEALLLDHLRPLADPARGARQREQAREHVRGDAERAQHDARVEVHVRVQLPLDEVVVGECDALELHGNLQRGIFHVHHLENVLYELAEVFGARIVVLVDAMAEAHEAHAVLLVLHLAHKLCHVLLLADLRQHVDHRLVGAAVRGPPQASDASRHARIRVRLGGASDADGGGGGVLLVVHVEDHDDVHRACQQRVTLPHLILL